MFKNVHKFIPEIEQAISEKEKFSRKTNDSKAFESFENYNRKITVDRSQLLNIFANSNLFAAVPDNAPREFSKDPVRVEFVHDKNVTQDGTTLNVFWEFYQLNQFDLDVLLALIQLSNRRFKIKFTKYGLLKAMGLDTCKSNYDRIMVSLAVMSRTYFSFVFTKSTGEGIKSKIFSGSLINMYEIDLLDEVDEKLDPESYNEVIARLKRGEARNQISVAILPMLRSVLEDNYLQSWSFLDMKQRRQLKNQVSKKVHAYLSSCDRPKGRGSKGDFFIKKEDFYKYFCGNKKLKQWEFFRDFKRRNVLELEKCGFLQKFDFHDKHLAIKWCRPHHIPTKVVKSGEKLIRRKSRDISKYNLEKNN